jgi:lipopolysaccharide/colanic/teichoic acid biosynthesis glycosyltransferase
VLRPDATAIQSAPVGDPPALPVNAAAPTSRAVRALGRGLDRCARKVLDVGVAALLLLLLLPVIFGVGVAIRLDSSGPAFYRCRRVGHCGVEFEMLKFRKMRDDAQGPALTATRDERFTRLGRFLASSKLDEVPQLWNVLRGEMSLVGPRPEDPSFAALQPEAYAEILRVKPGITGYSQLAFARESEILDAQDRVSFYVERLLPQKAGLDRLYASHRTVMTNLRILRWTAVAVLFGHEVAVNRETGRVTRRRRPPILADAPQAARGLGEV